MGRDGLINGGGEWRIPHHISIINFAFGERKMGKKAHRPNDCPAGEIRASRGRGTPPPIAKWGRDWAGWQQMWRGNAIMEAGD
jgi:hypothetical protein